MRCRFVSASCRTGLPRSKSWHIISHHLRRCQSAFGPHIKYVRARRYCTSAWIAASLGALLVASFVFYAAGVDAATLLAPSSSTTITISPDNRWLLVVNRETHSLSIIGVRDDQGQDIPGGFKLTEIPVGLEPRCVALHPDLHEIYVTNGISGTVSVINVASLRVVQEIPVGTEPRGCALTPNGTFLLVANHTEGTVGVIHTPSHAFLGILGVEESYGDRHHQ